MTFNTHSDTRANFFTVLDLFRIWI